jgi:fibronectin-binding autotransporter adhesin
MKNLTALISAIVIGVAPLHGQVTNVYWDPAGTASTDGGGAGTWNFSSLQWYDGTSDVVWDNAGDYRAIFGGASGGQVTIAAGLIVLADSLVFNTPGYNIFGGGVRRVTLTTGIIEANADVTITTAITNPASATALVGITKTGDGKLTFAAGNNTFLGGLYVLGGVVAISDKNQIGGPDQGITLNGGGLELTTVQAVSGRTLEIGDNGGTIHLPGLTDQWSFNDLQGMNGSFTKTGAGTLIMSGAGTNGASRTGATLISEGVLRAETTVASGLGVGPVTVGANGTLAGSGIVGGEVTVFGTLAPGTSVGTLTLQSGLSLTDSARMVFELGTPDIVGGTENDLISVAGDLTLDGVIDIIGLASFGEGTYRLINYEGTLINNGIELGTISGLADNSFNYVFNAGGGEVNLIVSLIPEPGSCALLLLGGVLVALARRRLA